MISGIVTVSKCSFLENMSDVDYEPAIYNVGTLSAMGNCSFFDSSFDCHPGTYFNYHAVRNRYANHLKLRDLLYRCRVMNFCVTFAGIYT